MRVPIIWGFFSIFLGIVSLKIMLLPNAYIEGDRDLPSGVTSNIFKPNPLGLPDEVIDVRVLVAADEEYRKHMSTFGMGWIDEAMLVLERADNAFYRDFGINFMAAGFVEWESTNRKNDGVELLMEAQSDLNWRNEKGVYDILLVFTGQDIQEFAGWAEHYSGSKDADAVILQHQFDLWRRYKDWHVLQEELAHLFGAPDHVSPTNPNYWREDIMSYKWLYYTDKWDNSCREIIQKNRYRFSGGG